MFRHVFYTWALANFLVPCFYLVVELFSANTTESIFHFNTPEDGAVVFFLFIFLSAPCFYISILFLEIMIWMKCNVTASLIAWLACIALLILGFACMVDNEISARILSPMLPGIAASYSAILFRYYQFKKFIRSQKNIIHKNNMIL